MFYDLLSRTGVFTLFLLTFLIFILTCFSATSSWYKVELSECTIPSVETLAPPPEYRNGQVKLYMQPNTGMCWVANAVSSVPSQCKTWADSTYWKYWGELTKTGSGAYDAVAAIPKVYSLAVALIFFALIPSCIIVFHYFKPENLSTKMTQILTSLFMLLVFIFSCIDPAKANSSIICDDANWKTFYINQYALTCDNSTGGMYIGGGLAVCNVFLSFFAFILATFPGYTMKFLTDGGGYTSSNNANDGGSGKEGGGGNGDSNSMRDSLVGGDVAESQYVPPSI